MTNFNKIKRYYEKGIYKISHVRAFVKANKLTIEEFTLITGEIY